jgi:hypothetical protein
MKKEVTRMTVGTNRRSQLNGDDSRAGFIVRQGLGLGMPQSMLFDSLAAVESFAADRLSILGHEKGDEEIMGLWDQIHFLWTWCKSDESEQTAALDGQWTTEPDTAAPMQSPLANILREMKAGRQKVDRLTGNSFSTIHRRPLYRGPRPSIADTAE